jgi:hypothetical protein
LGQPFPQPYGNQDGDAPAVAPQGEDRSILGANAAGATRRILVGTTGGVLVEGPVTTSSVDTFTRIQTEQFHDTEEVRIDKPTLYDGTFEYIGLATAGSSTASLSWNVVRVSWVLNRKTRLQYRANISWDNRTSGWPS